jgi:alpha-ketoglutarate-dependent sulfate ester dioxygenase
MEIVRFREGQMTVTASTHIAPATEIEFRKVTANIGAEVEGVDIASELDDSTVAALREGLNEHKVLVFRNVELDDSAQERFARSFGELTTAHPTVPSVEGAPNVLPVDSDLNIANHWHTDVTFVVNPPQLSTLRSVVIPPYGGETLIANAGAAYRSLPDALRRLADELWAVHTNVYDYARAAVESLDDKSSSQYKQFIAVEYETAHPVVRVHPLTGEKGLFIGGFAQNVVGLPTDAGRDTLRILQSYVTRPEHVLRWRWSPNELVLFDNRITQHYAIDNYDRRPRKLRRVTVAGDVPVGVDGGTSYSIKGSASHYSNAPDVAA